MDDSILLQNNIYLAKIIDFENYLILENYLDLPANFNNIQYGFVVKIDNYCYDLANGKRYSIINKDKKFYILMSSTKYIYDMYPFAEICNNFNDLGISEISIIKLLNSRADYINSKLGIDEEKCKITDLSKIKKYNNNNNNNNNNNPFN